MKLLQLHKREQQDAGIRELQMALRELRVTADLVTARANDLIDRVDAQDQKRGNDVRGGTTNGGTVEA